GNWLVTRPLQLLARKDRAADFARINAIIVEQRAVGVVVGLPEQPADQPAEQGSAQANTVRRWASRLAAAVSIPVYLWEEQFSSLEAERLMEEAGHRGTGRVDAGAAAVILQSFIEAHPLG